jgi:hypothetical protein
MRKVERPLEQAKHRTGAKQRDLYSYLNHVSDVEKTWEPILVYGGEICGAILV